MKILHRWLEEILQTSLEPEKTAHILTSIGLEVENMEKISSVKGCLDGLVAGRVISVLPHPNADRLKLTRVRVSDEKELQIVCGAPNVSEGQTVAVALPGCVLQPWEGEPIKIKKSKIRGVESEGMICSEHEMGIGQNQEGILVLEKEYRPGTAMKDILPRFDDVLYEIGLTPNRGDAASHYGIARDLKAWLNVHEHLSLVLHFPFPAELPRASGILNMDIEILDTEKCQRFAGVVISGIRPHPLPPVMKFRLEACGFRCIHPVVDITNYVMMECGQPLHAYDYEKITGKKIIVGVPHRKTPFTLLDGSTIQLTEDDLVIGNEKEPMCLAGIFGGKESGITHSTHAIFLESAYFNSHSIRKSASYHKLKTESSFRFGRGTNPDFVIPALHRAASLILDICEASISAGPVDLYPKNVEPRKVAFSYSLCHDLLGHEVPHHFIHSVLEQMEIRIEAESKDGALCLVPAFKTDVCRQADLVEEIARIYGYDNIPPTPHFTASGFSLTSQNKKRFFLDFLSEFLVHKGFYEVQGLSLEKSSWHSRGNHHSIIEVLNPVSSDSAYLRANLFFSGIQVLVHNIRRQQKDLRFFETGKIYRKNPQSGMEEKEVFGIYTSGRLFPMNHYRIDFQTGLSDHLGVVYELCDIAGIAPELSDYEDQWIKGVSLGHNGKIFGFCGQPTPLLLDIFDMDEKIPLCISQWEMAIFSEIHHPDVLFSPYSGFPSIRRDLSFVIDRKIPYKEITGVLRREVSCEWLRDIKLFDLYEGKNIEEGKKSLALSFTFQSEKRTLKDEEVNLEMEKIVLVLQKHFLAEIRS